MELIWKVTGEMPLCIPVDIIKRDFWARPVKTELVPGPFGTLPRETEKIKIVHQE